jgi:flagellar motility protein MotE (MotC chaperone)
MKILGVFLLAIASFLLTLLGAMALTGNLSKEQLSKLFAGEEPAPATPQEEPDDLDPILKALSGREEEIKERETELREWEGRLKLRERDLEELADELRLAHTQFVASLDEADADYAERIAEASKTLGKMKPKNAAEVLKAWPPEDGARILMGVDDRSRGKILDELDPDKAALFLRALQEREY